MADENEVVLYVVVNDELAMTPGKVAAQVAHGVVEVCLQRVVKEALPLYLDESGYVRADAAQAADSPFAQWLNGIYKKVTLKAPQAKLEELVAAGFLAIRDAGHTQVAPNSLTVVALPPMRRADARAYVGGLPVY